MRKSRGVDAKMLKAIGIFDAPQADQVADAGVNGDARRACFFAIIQRWPGSDKRDKFVAVESQHDWRLPVPLPDLERNRLADHIMILFVQIT